MTYISFPITVESKKERELIDITPRIYELCKRHSFHDGLCSLWVLHTSCAITTADLDPGTDEDFLDACEAIFPKLNFRHTHDPSHVWQHIVSSLIDPGVTFPIENCMPKLGRWQNIVLIELNGPRTRTIQVSFVN